MSFQKVGASKVPFIEGTQASVRSQQLLTSTGIGALDALLGGGLPAGAIVAIEEDAGNAYAPYFLRYFLAEGCVHKQSLFVVGSRSEAKDILSNLPAASEGSAPEEPAVAADVDQMKIAWRYETVGKVQSTIGRNTQAQNFDLATKMGPEVIDRCQVSTYPDGQGSSLSYEQLFEKLLTSLKTDCHSKVSSGKKNLLRIAIESIGSPLWVDDDGMSKLVKFLLLLKTFLRQSYAVALLTVPSLAMDEKAAHKVHRYCDAVFRLESFSDTDRQAVGAFADAHGLFHIVKLPALHVVSSALPESVDLCFKLKRRRLAIEILHLPPAIGEETDDLTKQFSCSTNISKSKIDF
uniref:Elongator complex protein 4 n=1 Tax=Plectus sambesii TaxID=2011161 RepID=A0A914URR0_9BILA